MATGAVPGPLKAISHYLKTANELLKLNEKVVAYYCRIYAVQKGLQISEAKPECRKFLYEQMDVLEKMKTELAHEDVMQNDVVAGVHVENYAMKVFEYADNEDRASRFTKNVIKSFYTAGLLFDVLSTFGELSEEIVHKRKYAKWKALYINKCLKENTIPIPGPMANEEEFGTDEAIGGAPQPGTSAPTQPTDTSQPAAYGFNLPSPPPSSGNVAGKSGYIQPPGAHAPPTTPQEPPAASGVPSINNTQTPTPSGKVSLTPQQFQQAMKYCKYASSALQYEDSATAVDNLNKALKLITTGQNS